MSTGVPIRKALRGAYFSMTHFNSSSTSSSPAARREDISSVELNDIGFDRQLRDIYAQKVLYKGEDRKLITELRAAQDELDAYMVLLQDEFARELDEFLDGRQDGAKLRDEIAAGKVLPPRAMFDLLKDRRMPRRRETAAALRQQENSRQRLIDGVQQYVVRIARSFTGRGIDLPDLIQEGNLGVIRAMETYDLDRNLAFLTYADDWIRQRILRACTDRGSIERYGMRLPCHQYTANGRVQKVLPKLQDSLGREPTIAEIAQAAEVKESQAEWAVKTLNFSMVSLDSSWQSDDSSEASIGEVIADEKAIMPEDALVHAERDDTLWAAFAELDSAEQIVLALRGGLNLPADLAELVVGVGAEIGRKYNQDEVQEMLGITKSKLSAVRRSALQKLAAAPDLGSLVESIGTDM